MPILYCVRRSSHGTMKRLLEAPFGEPENAGDRFSGDVSPWLDGKQRVSALPRPCARVPERLIRGCGILGVVLGATAYGLSEVPKPATAGPVDGAALETTVRPPIAGPAFAASRPDNPALGAPAGNPLWSIPLDSLSITRERPLFSPSRRPPPSAVVAAPPAPPVQAPKPAVPDRPPLTLVGTAVGKTLSVGVFVDQDTKDVVRLRTGEDHAGWRLHAINGREAILEKDQLQVTLALPARSAADAAAGPVPPPAAVAARPAAPMGGDGRLIPPRPSLLGGLADGKPGAVPPSMWLDGDGQIISPPPSSSNHAEAKPGAASPSVWLDGDGQAVSAPPSPGAAEDGKPLGPSLWSDGYGRPIGPAPSVWLDGDGQSIRPPPFRRMDEDEKPVIPPPTVWLDGDGQPIGPPLTRTRQSAQH
jgi:general secretion pathway protein N